MPQSRRMFRLLPGRTWVRRNRVHIPPSASTTANKPPQTAAPVNAAFRARWSNGAGPTLAGYAEYDAVPGQSQAPEPQRKPRDGTSFRAAGHTDPHSALGIGSFGGCLAAKHAMETHGLKGTLVYFGDRKSTRLNSSH